MGPAPPTSGHDGSAVATANSISIGGSINKHQIEGNWKQVKGRVKEEWGKLTNDDLDQIDGRRERLVGKVQERYGKTKEAAEEEVGKFFDSVAA